MTELEQLKVENAKLRIRCVELQLAYNQAVREGVDAIQPYLEQTLMVLRKQAGDSNGG